MFNSDAFRAERQFRKAEVHNIFKKEDNLFVKKSA